MDFGKLPSVDLVDFSLPPEPSQNAAILGRQTQHQALYLGATGYNMRPWVGKWYPLGAKDRDYLRHYGMQFNTIEHNTTHYRIPDTVMVDRWRDETPDDFRFCPKIPQTISHARDLGLSSRETMFFCEVIEGLETKLGHCFMQLPPAFSPKDLPLLERFLARFPTTVPLAVEVRHPAFFQPGQGEDFFELLRRHNIATVITDVAGRRDVCHMRLTSATVLIRFVGNGLHPSDYTRINEWSSRLKNWMDQGLESVYFFTHEPDNLLAPDLAAAALAVFSQSMPTAAMRGPAQVPGQQGSLF